MQGIHHLGLAVSNLEESASFFCDLLGWTEVRRKEDYPAIFVSNGSVMFTLWQTDDKACSFNRKTNIGLHHVALKMDSREELSQIYEDLKTSDKVKIEFAPEKLGKGPAQHMICIEPSGIRIEFVWVP